jgi:hypothetical protein
MSKIIKVDEYGRVPLENFSDLVDIDKVEYYSIKIKKDKSLSLKFYDKKKRVVKPNAAKR